MKRAVIFLYLIFICINSTAQTPEFINYQAIVRDGGEVISGQTVYYRFGIIKGELPGETVYTEKHTTTTNQFGLVTLAIGNGTDKTGDFSAIEWGGDIYFLKVEIDIEGDEVYTDMGTTRMLSVPYALHAKTAAAADETDPEVGVNTIDFLSKWDGTSLIKSSVIDNGKIGIGTNDPSALLDLNIPADFPSPGFNIKMPDYSDQTMNHNAFTISSAWDAEGIARTNIFTLEDEESSPVMTLRRLGYNHVTVLTPGALYFAGEGGNNIYLNWEEGFSYGTLTSGYNLQMNNEFPLYYRTYSGTWTDKIKLTKQGNAYFAGNLQVGGNISGEFEIDSIHVSKITGLLGENYTLNFPSILDNLVTLLIDGITLNDKVVMISGPGIEIERIIGFHDPEHHNDQPGLSMEFPIIFETSGDDAQTLISWFDTPDPDLHNASVVIKNLAGTETGRWNMIDGKPAGYEPGNDGRTRFTLVHDNLPDNVMGCYFEGSFGTEYNINEETDKWVQIESVETGLYFFPGVEIDYENRTLTFTMDYNEGGPLHDLVLITVVGAGNKRNISVIESDLDVPPFETSRRNYYYCFPIRYEHFYGFGLNTKLKARVVFSFDWWEQG